MIQYTEEQTRAYIIEARDYFGSKTFMADPERIEQLSKFLGHLYLCCPEKLSMSVYGTLDELNRREMMLTLRF